MRGFLVFFMVLAGSAHAGPGSTPPASPPGSPPKKTTDCEELRDAEARGGPDKKHKHRPGAGDTHLSDSKNPTPSPTTAYESARSPNDKGSDLARTGASTARSDAGGWRSFASSERSLASSISQAYSSINGYSQPRLASPDPQVRAQAQQYLSQPVEAPAGQSREFQNLGLNTNRDVLNNGPEYSDNLNNAADQHENDAKTLDKMADQADAAADKMKQFSKTLDQRNENIQSVDDQKIVSANRGGAKDNNSSLASASGDGTGASANAANGGDGVGFIGSIQPSGVKSGSVTDSGKGSSKADGDGAVNLSGGGRRLASLSDQLKDSLADGSGKAGKGGKDEKDAVKSEFDSFFAKKDKNADGKDGKVGSDITVADGKDFGANGHGGFSLAGSDTDRAVKGLLGGIQGADDDKRVFGDIDQTIFARMKKYLTKAQQAKKVGN